MAEDFGLDGENILSSLIEEVIALKAGNDEKDAEIDQLANIVENLVIVLSKLVEHANSQHHEFLCLKKQLRLLGMKQSIVVQLLENQSRHAREKNVELSMRLEKSAKENQEQQNALERKAEHLIREVKSRMSFKENMENWLSKSVTEKLPDVAQILERSVAEIEEAHQENRHLRKTLQKFKVSDSESRRGFDKLCNELMAKQKQLIENLQRSSLRLADHEKDSVNPTITTEDSKSDDCDD